MSKVIYKAAGPVIASDEEAQRVGEYLDSTFKDMAFDSASVVSIARHKSSPIHSYFEWDDKLAAEKHRETQAAHLIRSILVVEKRDGKEIESRGFHYVTVAGPDESVARAFVNQRVVWKDPDLSSQVLAKALGELRSWKQRYQTYSELAKATKAVGSAISLLEEAA